MDPSEVPRERATPTTSSVKPIVGGVGDKRKVEGERMGDPNVFSSPVEDGNNPPITASGVTLSVLWKFEGVTTLETSCGCFSEDSWIASIISNRNPSSPVKELGMDW